MKGIMIIGNDREQQAVDRIVKEKGLDIDSKVGSLAELTDKELDKYEAVIGYYPHIDGVMLKRFARHGIRYYITRSTGYNHIDLPTAKQLGIKVANVRAYSPNAIAELTLALALALNRNIVGLSKNIHEGRFERQTKLFKEIRDCTVGILGTGNIGMVTASYYHALGAEVIGYDKYPKAANEALLSYRSFAEVIAASDILIVHMPYIKDETHYLINKDSLKAAKEGLIIVNTARGELVNLADIVTLIESGKIAGYAADVFEHEDRFIGKDVKTVDDPVIARALALYPQIILTPHVGASTERAIEAMIEIAIDDFAQYARDGSCAYELTDNI